MSRRPLLVVVLAAGQGTRMKSALPKVLHKIGGRSMLGHVLARCAIDRRRCSLPSSSAPAWTPCAAEALASRAKRARSFVQEQQRGTADAVLAAREALATHSGDVLVLYADTPLLPSQTLDNLRCPPRRRRRHRRARLRGRRSGRLRPPAHRRRRLARAIREDKDASEAGAPRPAVQLRRHGFSLR